MVHILHIQQAKLEEGSGTYQPGEKLEVSRRRNGSSRTATGRS
jgi:hypothetical protein